MKLTTDSGISQEFPLPTFTEISHEMWNVKKKKDKSVPLQARGAQRVP